jgi:hypothetical protein
LANLTRFGYEDVNQDDELRRVVINMADLNGAATDTAADIVLVQNLPDSGGTIEGVYARAITAPAGSSTVLTYDIHKNGTTIFTDQTNRVIFATTEVSAKSETIEVANVVNGDILVLACDAVGNTTAGTDIAVAIVIKVDKPLDDD